MEQRRGIWYGVAGYVLWGLTPIFWKALEAVPAVEILAHRVLWSLPILAVVITARRTWRNVVDSYAAGRTRRLALLGGILLAINWGVYVWAVTNGHIVEASLGYFINPLVSVALGVIVLGERLRTAQRVAVAIAAAGVVGMTIAAGVVPWISLTLALSFGTYGLLKKRPGAAPPLAGLFGETSVLVLPAVVLIGALAMSGDGSLATAPSTTLLLVAGGAVTVAPLLLFGASAQRIPLSMVGLLQYLTPTLQFLIGVVIYGEEVSGAKLFGFAMVWLALAIYTTDNLQAARREPGSAEPDVGRLTPTPPPG